MSDGVGIVAAGSVRFPESAGQQHGTPLGTGLGVLVAGLDEVRDRVVRAIARQSDHPQLVGGVRLPEPVTGRAGEAQRLGEAGFRVVEPAEVE